jgi:hypothetical protein
MTTGEKIGIIVLLMAVSSNSVIVGVVGAIILLVSGRD